MLPIVHVDCDYAAPLRLGERVRIDATLARLGERSFTMAYTFDREDGQRCGRATTVHASVSNQTGRAVPVPREIRRALEGLDRG
jgi:4-hydroxybenzoyl-CoA thioesterase